MIRTISPGSCLGIPGSILAQTLTNGHEELIKNDGRELLEIASKSGI